jgi:hypothetical protein
MKSLDKIATKTDEEVTNGAAMAAVLAALLVHLHLGLLSSLMRWDC